MILPVHASIRSAITQALGDHFRLPQAEHPAIVIGNPPSRTLGDLAVPVAFELAKRLRKAPRTIAEELARVVPPITGVAKVEAAPNGHLNFFLDRAAFLIDWLDAPGADGPRVEGKIVVEHTAINPNKAAHIGHLRNSALGDTLVRLLRFQGHQVEVQNYIDDTGVQVADVVVGFTTIEGRDLASVRALADDPSRPFDFYCWDLYAKVTEWYAEDKERLAIRARTLHDIEHGVAPLADLAAFVADRIVRCHLRTMARLNVDYDLLTWEGDILRLQFWATAFEDLKRRGSVTYRTDGRLAGCWVMPIDGAAGTAPSDVDGDDAEEKEKVIVRSNGTVTYVGKDIANQFWKFGLLGRDFHYRPFTTRADGTTLWATTSGPTDPAAPPFGRATAVYNVIDSRQAYLQQLLKQALATVGCEDQANRSTHFSYEMVALSHATARALGYEAEAADGKPFVEVSGRKGLGVKADDLIDRLITTAAAEVARRNPALSPDDVTRTAGAIATSAVRYFLIKFTRGKIIAFDIDEALSFEGETGPYLQYAAVRANNIMARLAERDGVRRDTLPARLRELPVESLTGSETGDELWGLVLEAARLDEAVDSAVRSLELSVVAKHAFGLAQAFNAFYHRQQILREEEEAPRLWRAAAVEYAGRQITRALELMGCQVPNRM